MPLSSCMTYLYAFTSITYDTTWRGENALRALFCEKNGFNMGVNRRGLGRFSFRPKSPQKGWGHLKHDFRLTERLLPDSIMTYRGRSDGLVVESDRKKIITFKLTCHLRDLQGYCVYTSGVFFFVFFCFFFLGSASFPLVRSEEH